MNDAAKIAVNGVEIAALIWVFCFSVVKIASLTLHR
jgi:hypothetical protein